MRAGYSRILCGLAALAVIALTCQAPALAADYYVDALYGDDGNSGLSWAAAKATITAGVALVTEVDCTVHVATGYYFERFTIAVDGTVLLGGYPPGGGTRNPWALTDIYGGGTDSVIIVSDAADVMIDGFTVRGGSALNGGGIFCDVTTGAIISNCSVRTNSATGAGGGIAVRNGFLTIDSCYISDNSCTGAAGGGVAAINSNLTMIGCAVERNLITHTAPCGGGVSVDGTSTFNISACTIEQNTAETVTAGTSLSAYGGGIYALGIGSLSSNFISGNVAHGTLVVSSTASQTRYAYGGGLYCGGGAQVTAQDNVFDGNSSYAEARNSSTGATYAYSYGGGACCAANSQLTLSGDMFDNNIADAYGELSGGRAYTYGGGLACQNSSRVTAGRGVEFRGNLARSIGTAAGYSYGGAIYGLGSGAVLSFNGVVVMGNDMLTSPDSSSLGEGCYFESCPVSLTNCIVAENGGDGVYMYTTPATAVIRNCTIAYNELNGLKGHNASTYADVSNCILWGNYDDLTQLAVTFCNVQEGASGTGNINPPCNPVFVGNGDYHILPQSCCIDRGTIVGLVNSDIDGDVRPYPGTLPDIGADEVGVSNPTPTPFATPPGGVTATPYPTPANDFYVDRLLGDDSDDGLSWGTAKASIAAAVDLAGAAGSGTVHVASGIYNENVAATDNLLLLGGYPHGGGSRDPAGFPTLIDGGNVESAVLISEVDNVVIDGFTIRNGRGGFGGGIYISRSQNVRIAHNVITLNQGAESPNMTNIALGGGIYIYGTDIVIEENNILNNSVVGLNARGGGIYVAGGHKLVIRNNTIQQNTAVVGGAGIAVVGGDSATLLEGNLIQANTTLNMSGAAYCGGAGLRVEAGGWVRAVNNTFANNSATAPAATSGIAYGGAIFCAGDLQLEGNVLTGNSASVNATANYNAFGGALFCAAGGDVTSDGNQYLSNQAIGYTYTYGGAVAVEANGAAMFTSDTFRGNSATSTANRVYGGAIFAADQSTVTVSFGSLFEQNAAVTSSSYAYGGAVCVWGANAVVLIDGVMMRQNVAQGQSAAYHYGHGLQVYQAAAMVQNSFFVRHAGNAVLINSSNMTFRNNTVADNNGIGVRQVGSTVPVVVNCIIWGNTDDIDAVSVTYCNVQEGAVGEGNFNPPANPQFIGGGDYHILRTSPCVDRGSYLGNPNHDCDNETRPYASTLPDVGADEVMAVNPTATPTATGSVPPTATPAGTLTPTATAVPSNNYYVDCIYGNDAWAGTSWGTAKKTVGAAAALAAAANGGIVHVAMGTYVENVALESHIRLWGGYPHGGGVRRPESFQTILDGGGVDAVLRLGSAVDVEIDGFLLTNGRGGFGGAVNMSRARSIHITNNTIAANQCLNAPPLVNIAWGGGVFIDGTDITIADNLFTANSVNGTVGEGGAIYCAAGQRIYIRNNTFTGNTATHSGGAIYSAATEAPVLIDGNTFTANQALCTGTSGGGALCLGPGAKATVTDNVFSGNLASILNTLGGTCYGGAIFCSGQLALSGNEFTGNIAQAQYSGSTSGAYYQYAYGGALYCATGGTISSSGNEYSGNQASAENLNTYASVASHAQAYGGAMYCANGGQITVDADLFEGNMAYSDADSTGYARTYGGALCGMDGSVFTVNRGTIIRENMCLSVGTSYGYSYGGGVYLYSASAVAQFDGVDIRGNSLSSTPDNVSYGEGFYIESCPAHIVNCFIVEHPVDGLYLRTVTNTMRVINCTIANNKSAGIRGSAATPDIHNCILWGNADDLVSVTATYCNIQGGDPGEGNLVPPCNPLFVGGGDYHIMPQSCCVDRGTVIGITTHDVDGDIRPYNGSLIDIGADEVPAFNPTATPYSTPTGSETPTPVPTPAHNFYVDKLNGSDSNNGLSWATAKASISAAVELARLTGDGWIHVAVGIYNERLTPGANTVLWGGYPPGGGVRDPLSQITIIDGGGLDSVVAIGGVSNVEIDGFTIQNGRGGYGGGIVAVNSSDLRIRNNIITGNICLESPTVVNLALGGGLYLQGSRITVEDNEIRSNSVTGNDGWGGGIYCVGGEGIVIRGNIIAANSAQAGGAGIAVTSGGTVVIEDNIIDSNSCVNSAGLTNCGGGALRLLTGSSVIVRGNTISNNSVTVSSSTVTAYGGGIYCEGALTLEDNDVQTNAATADITAGFYAYGGGLYCASGSVVISSGNTYSGNTALAYYVYAAGICCATGAQLTMTDDAVLGNIASSSNYRVYGGGISCLNSSTVNIGRGVLIDQNGGVANNSHCSGGGIYITGAAASVVIDGAVIKRNSVQASSTTYAYGHGIYNEASPMELRNSFVVQNKWADSYGVGIYLSGGSPMVVNCTIADNRNIGIRWAGSGAPDVRNCIVWGHIDDLYSIAATYSNTMEGLAGTGNIIPPAEPMFVSEDDYHILPTSPCVDRGLNTGAPAFDIDGDSRPYNGLVVDIGADETSGAFPTPVPSATPATPTPVGSPTPTYGPGYYVDQVRGSDSNNGLSWATAKASIGAALALAPAGSVVHVGRGAYQENLDMPTGVTLLGGYPSGGGARNPVLNACTVNAGGLDSTVKLSNVQHVTIDGFTITNGYNVRGGGLYCYGSNHIILSNLVIQNNTAGSRQTSNYGGGAYFNGCYDLWIQDCLFQQNTATGSVIGAGGAAYFDSNSQILIAGNTFAANQAYLTGGALQFMNGGSDIVIADNTFSANQAYYSTYREPKGGGIYQGAGVALEITGNTFDTNMAYAVTAGTPNTCHGGALYLLGSAALEDNLFTGNQARYLYSGSYGAVAYTYAYGGAVYCGGGSVVTSTGNLYTNNWANSDFANSHTSYASYSYSYGGAVYIDAGSQFTATNETYSQNTSYARGITTSYAYAYAGAIHCAATTQITLGPGLIIEQNVAQSSAVNGGYTYGGGIFADTATSLLINGNRIRGNDVISAPTSAMQGDGLYINGSVATVLTNCFITANAGHGLYVYNGGSALISNNTFADNTTHGIYRGSGTVAVTNCILWNNGDDLLNTSSTYCCVQDGDAGTGNISANPQFMTPDFHIQGTSPCKDAGLPQVGIPSAEYDIDGDARPQGTQFDMGADEFTGAPRIALTVELDGFYNSGTQAPATVNLQLRSGAGPATATTVIASLNGVTVDADGYTGAVDLPNWPPSSNYYLVVSHLNHLTAITAEPIVLELNETTYVNLADSSSADYAACYGTAALKTEGDSTLSLRGGNANGDRYINASGDFVIWYAANGSIPGDANWDERADFNGNEAINSSDFSVWLAQNGRSTWAPDAVKAGRTEVAAAWQTRSGPLSLRMLKAPGSERQWIDVEVVYEAAVDGRALAVDAAVAFDPKYFREPSLIRDTFEQMTDFSLGCEGPAGSAVFHYSRGTMPGERGARVRAGENVVYRLRFPLRHVKLPSQLPIGFAPGFADVAMALPVSEVGGADLSTAIISVGR